MTYQVDRLRQVTLSHSDLITQVATLDKLLCTQTSDLITQVTLLNRWLHCGHYAYDNYEVKHYVFNSLRHLLNHMVPHNSFVFLYQNQTIVKYEHGRIQISIELYLTS